MPVQKNIAVFEAMTLVDKVNFVLTPTQGYLVDRLIQQDAYSSYINGAAFKEQLQQIDLLQFVLAGGTGQLGIYIAQDLYMQDHFNSPNVFVTQAGREVALLPTDANVRLTQAGREVALLPTGSTKARITQAGREVVIASAEAYQVISDYQMLITETLLMQESLLLLNAGKYLLLINDRLTPGITDQDTNQNVKVKGNQNVRADKFVTNDTSLNHWLDAIAMLPFNQLVSAADQMNTQADALAKTLAISVLLTQTVTDQFQGMTDATPTLLGTMQLSFIQTMNQWQEFIFGQPLAPISAQFAEVMQDQDQETLSGFQPYFIPLSDTMTFSDVMYLPMQESFADTLTLTENVALAEELDEMFVDALVFSDALAFNNPQAYQDQLTMLDSFTIAEAIDELLSDNLNNWADALAELLSTTSFQDQLVLSDSFLLGYGNAVPDQLTLTDSDAMLFTYGIGLAEQFLMNDQFGEFPNGLLIIDQLFMSDSIQFPVWLALADQLAQADAMGTGYGNAESDTNTMADSMRLVESFEAMLQDATPAQLDSLNTLFNFLLAIDDQVFMVEQLLLMYGLSITGQFMEFDDEINVVGIILPNLQDDIANWLDGILTELVFAPTDVVVRDIRILAQLVQTFVTQAQQQATTAVVTPEVQQTNSIELLDVIE